MRIQKSIFSPVFSTFVLILLLLNVTSIVPGYTQNTKRDDNAANIFYKTVELGSAFTINIVSIDPEESYIVSFFETEFLTNNHTQQKDNLISFSFTTINSGTATINIDRVLKVVEKNYLVYRITILKPNEKETLETLSPNNQEETNKVANQEKKSYLAFKSYIDDDLYNIANNAYKNYIEKYQYTGSYAYNFISSIIPMWHTQKQYQQAIDEITLFKEKNDTLPKAKEQFLNHALAVYQQALGQYDKALVLLYQIKSELNEKDELYIKTIYNIADIAFSQKKKKMALKNYLDFYKFYKDKNKRYQVLNYDKALFNIATIYEKEPSLVDIQKSYAFYKRLVQEAPLSDYLPIVKIRMRYLQKNFIDLQ